LTPQIFDSAQDSIACSKLLKICGSTWKTWASSLALFVSEKASPFWERRRKSKGIKTVDEWFGGLGFGTMEFYDFPYP
jgi:hypothetical protein